MLTKKSLLITGAVATVGVAGTIGLQSASAFNNSNHDINDTEGLITKLAQKFNVSEDEIQTVFDEYKSDQQDTKISEYLQRLVDRGKITIDQKTVIETKLVDIRAQMSAEKDALEMWAETEGVDVSYMFKYNLDQLVEDGEITAEQKTAIEMKRDELRQKHQQARDDVKKWAEENNINLRYLMMDRGWFDNKNDHGYKDNWENKNDTNNG